jgi:hypothetical protein
VLIRGFLLSSENRNHELTHEKTENRIFFNAENAEYAGEEFNRDIRINRDKGYV